MSYEELGNLINENKADEIREVLNGMSEQELGLFMDLLDDDQAKYLETLLTEDTDTAADTSDVYSPGYVYEKVKEEDYPEILSIFEKYGYGKDEMEDWLSSKLTDIGDQFAELDSFIGSDPDTEDVNGDGDTDVVTADTNGNGEKDTAVVTADSEPEKKEAVKAAKEDLGLDKKDKTSTGKTKGELEKDKDVVSDEKKKDMTCSDATQKNIMAALLDHRF